MIVVFQHHPMEVPARLGAALRDAGHKLHVIELYEGDAVPVDLDNVDGVVTMGGPMNVDEGETYPWIAAEKAFLKKAHEAKLPMVGVCLGAQLIAAALGGEVTKMQQAEIGWGPVSLSPWDGRMDAILAGIPWNTTQFHLHGCEITTPPPGSTLLASSPLCKNQLLKIGTNVLVYQYHFEWDRALIHTILDDQEVGTFMQQHETDPQAVKNEIDKHYDLYRHLGDRMCKRIADLIFPLDHRLSHKSGTLTSFDPAIS